MSETYRPAARLREGMFLRRADGTWQEITSLVQILSPAKFAMVTLADGFEVSIPHTHEVNCRTAKQIGRGWQGMSAPTSRAPYGGTCVVCRSGIRRGDRVASLGGFWRHPGCTAVVPIAPAPDASEERRERYAAALAECRTGLDMADHLELGTPDAAMAVADEEQRSLRGEVEARRLELLSVNERHAGENARLGVRAEQLEELLAVAHQTSNAAETVIARVRDRCQGVRDRVGPGGMINASQILGLLSPTWPDGNCEAPNPAAAILADLIARCPEHGNRTESWPECRCDAARRAAADIAAEPQHEPGVVAYRCGRTLRCLSHKPKDMTSFIAVASEDLEDGGLCTYPDCGVDVLITGGN